MRVIFSRKGFDSGSGGCPSPIMPDGRMVSLPIPMRGAPKTYEDLEWAPGESMGALVRDLARKKVRSDYQAHLDPDLNRTTVARARGWRPLFGQIGAALSHLTRHNVGVGDMFLFFGLFRQVESVNGRWRWVRGARPVHVLFGWLQVGRVHHIEPGAAPLAWATEHPHFHMPGARRNTVFLSRRELALDGLRERVAGAGTFGPYRPELQLTGPNVPVSEWHLPRWMAPGKRRPALTYHGAADRWRLAGDRVRLRTVGRGQEFILDGAAYPELQGWLAGLFTGK